MIQSELLDYFFNECPDGYDAEYDDYEEAFYLTDTKTGEEFKISITKIKKED